MTGFVLHAHDLVIGYGKPLTPPLSFSVGPGEILVSLVKVDAGSQPC